MRSMVIQMNDQFNGLASNFDHTLKELPRETKVQVLWVVNHPINGTAHAFTIKCKEPTYLGQIVLCLCYRLSSPF